MKMERVPIEPTYKKPNGGWSLDTQAVQQWLPFICENQALIWIPPHSAAGNHRHTRREALIGLGDETFMVWQEDDGATYEEPMQVGETIHMFIIPPLMPHAVVNRSGAIPAILYEYFNDPSNDVERVNVIEPSLQ